MLPPLDTLPAWRPGTPTLGWTVLRWQTDPSRRRFTVPNGPRQGQLFAPTPRQLLFTLWWYSIAPDGLWLYRGAATRLSRGTGKSPRGAMLGITDFIGPARPVLDVTGRPTEVRPGELAGQPVSMPLVQFAAVSMEQTENTWKFVQAWAGKGTVLEREYDLDVGKTMITSPTRKEVRGGVMRQIASSAATARGGQPTCIIADEMGEWTVGNGGVRFASVLGDNTTKVPYARIYGLMNAWEPGGGSAGESLWDEWETERAVLDRVEHPSLMDVLEAPADTDWEDPASIREAMDLIYHDAPWIDVREIMTTILKPGKPLAESQREYGNMRVAAEDAWMTAAIVERNKIEDAAIQPGDTVTMACDPSDTDDSTGLTITRMSDGLTEVIWYHDPRASHRPTDFAELDAAVEAAFQTYDVVAFFSDANPAEHYVKNVWPGRYASRLLVEAAPGEPVAFDNRRHRLTMLRATEQARAELIAGTWPHNGHPILVRHLLNAHTRPSVGYVGIRKGDQTRKIDLAVTAIMSRHARRMVLDSKAWADRTRENFAWVM